MDNPLLDHVMSVSSLNLFATSPAAYREHILYPTKEVTTYFTKGSAVDCLITEPDEFQNKFAVIKTTRPSGMMGDLCRLMHEYEKVNTEGLPEETLFKVAYKKTGFKLKEESVWKKYQGPAIQQYMTFLRNSQGKDVITEAEIEQAKDVVSMLQNNPRTKWFMKDCKNEILCDVYDQLRVDFTYNDIACKGFLDRVVVNHNSKKVYPVDLKTTGKSVLEFRNSFIKYGYFRQAAFYQEGIKHWMSQDPKIKDYDIQNFRFVVAEMACKHVPVIYECSDSDLYAGKFGGELKSGSTKIKGFAELLEDVKWHRENDNWFTTAEHEKGYAKNGSVLLNVFKQSL